MEVGVTEDVDTYIELNGIYSYSALDGHIGFIPYGLFKDNNSLILLYYWNRLFSQVG